MNELDDNQEGAVGVDVSEDSDLDGSSKSSMPLVQKIIIAVVILVVQAASAHFIVKKVFFSKSPAEKAQLEKMQEKKPLGEVFTLTGIIVNPTGTRGSRHLLIDIGLETSDVGVTAELTLIEPQIRDNVLTFLSAQRVEILTDIQMRAKIKERVKEIVNYHLSEGQVEQVFFIRYVFQ
ncbi:MAG: flagellar basal body-associated FliL family protein [Candidatus Electryonea clarkiae]|nr:flagellar basal body-associated FliL family protein [Candidatus Electryonea clarkiae]MDP8287310.1 flagellar basal body-associated FliL family protein [Candidatus Electryonea clarkiae]